MSPDLLPSRFRCAVLAVLYGLMFVYASTIVSPAGYMFKPADPWDQWVRLIGVMTSGFVHNGSDQRADWMGNLVAVVPLGFLSALALRVDRPLLMRWVMGGLALLICLIYVIGLKCLQLWFPRTVTLNYITAQSLGVMLGVAAVVLGLDVMNRGLRSLQTQDGEALLVLAVVASLGAAVFTLSPYDIALSAGDLKERLDVVSQSLFSLPNADRAVWLRVVLYVAGGLIYAPVGVATWLIVQRERWRPDPGELIALQAVFVLAVWCVSLLILSAQPTVWTLISRTGGALFGMAVVRGVTRERLALIRPWLGTPLLWPLYIVAVLAVNDLLITHWRSTAQAWEAIDDRFFLPLWTHYIVTKAQATRSVAVHVVMYAPIGLFLWARAVGRIGRGRQMAAVLIGFCLSLLVEIGRWYHPDLKPDFNDAPLGAFAAWGALMLMPQIWTMLLTVARENRGR